MFKKFARIADDKEKIEVYNLLKLNLSICLFMAELLILAVMAAGLGWRIGAESIAAATDLGLGFMAGGTAAIGLMLLTAGLIRLPIVFAITQLQADFGRDPRPCSRRLKELVLTDLKRGLVIWLVSAGLFAVLVKMPLLVWALSAVGVGLLIILLDACFPNMFQSDRKRPLKEGELPASLMTRIDKWAPKTGLRLSDIVVSARPGTDLDAPRLEGLGRHMRLVIQEKAFAAFPPREMAFLTVAGVMGALVKVPLKFMLARLCAMFVAVPLAAILISVMGVSLWGYPLTVSPALATLFWLAAWFSYWLSELTLRLASRALGVQLAAAAEVVLQDEEALPAVLKTLAEKNFEESSPPAWREFLRHSHSRAEFIKRAKYYRHMAKYSE
ncbi:MAG: hypothetical protein LBS31_06905 [Candidatus Adiutrix sp.]|jgi:hypothetical protein|nr:hypothetical protein [Candidatus Adiutrix sp.]